MATPVTGVIVLADAQAIAGAGVFTSAAVDLFRAQGYASLQVEVTGEGILKAEQLGANDDATYIEPDGAADVLSGITKTSGPGADGKMLKQFSLHLARKTKIRFTNTDAVNGIVVTARLAIR
jgi:hypothetical protein